MFAKNHWNGNLEEKSLLDIWKGLVNKTNQNNTNNTEKFESVSKINKKCTNNTTKQVEI